MCATVCDDKVVYYTIGRCILNILSCCTKRSITVYTHAMPPLIFVAYTPVIRNPPFFVNIYFWESCVLFYIAKKRKNRHPFCNTFTNVAGYLYKFHKYIHTSDVKIFSAWHIKIFCGFTIYFQSLPMITIHIKLLEGMI